MDLFFLNVGQKNLRLSLKRFLNKFPFSSRISISYQDEQFLHNSKHVITFSCCTRADLLQSLWWLILSRWGFVPVCSLQRAFSLSWIIQWEHPVDGELGFETWERHLTHTQRGSGDWMTSGGWWCGFWTCHLTHSSISPHLPLLPCWGLNGAEWVVVRINTLTHLALKGPVSTRESLDIFLSAVWVRLYLILQTKQYAGK